MMQQLPDILQSSNLPSSLGAASALARHYTDTAYLRVLPACVYCLPACVCTACTPTHRFVEFLLVRYPVQLALGLFIAVGGLLLAAFLMYQVGGVDVGGSVWVVGWFGSSLSCCSPHKPNPAGPSRHCVCCCVCAAAATAIQLVLWPRDVWACRCCQGPQGAGEVAE